MLHQKHSHSSHELRPLKKQKPFDHIKNTFKSLHTHISLHPRFWLFNTFIFIQVLIVLLIRTTPFSISIVHHQPLPITQNAVVCLPPENPPPPSIPEDSQCPFGRVYVYKLPPKFNKELIEASCEDLDQWKWECGIATNNGFGKPADELAGILPESVLPAWYRTNQFSTEVLFHQRMLNYKCRTLEGESATAYYIPFYAGLAVGKYLWGNDTFKRDYLGNKLLKGLQKQKYYKQFNGSDHFITLGRITWDFRRLQDGDKKWGSSFLNMPAMEEITRFTIEKLPADYLDLGVPYPIGFHPHNVKQLQQWQNFVRSHNRSRLFTFTGEEHPGVDNDFRSMLLSYCYNESDSCRVVDCTATRCWNGSLEYLPAALGSEFCLLPKGDSSTNRAVFDCMVAGSIPVFFWKETAYDQYEWFLPGEWESYSVFINRDDVVNGKSIKNVLERYSRKEIRKMREKVIEIIPKIIYSWPSEGLGDVKDAFDIAVEGVLSRFQLEKEWS